MKRWRHRSDWPRVILLLSGRARIFSLCHVASQKTSPRWNFCSASPYWSPHSLPDSRRAIPSFQLLRMKTLESSWPLSSLTHTCMFSIQSDRKFHWLYLHNRPRLWHAPLFLLPPPYSKPSTPLKAMRMFLTTFPASTIVLQQPIPNTAPKVTLLKWKSSQQATFDDSAFLWRESQSPQSGPHSWRESMSPKNPDPFYLIFYFFPPSLLDSTQQPSDPYSNMPGHFPLGDLAPAVHSVDRYPQRSLPHFLQDFTQMSPSW